MSENFIDDFLSGLENDKQQPKSSGVRIQKLLMSARDNQGTLVFAPFMSQDTKKFYEVLVGVREFNNHCSLYREGKDSVWLRILPKSAYGELTTEESALYDEVSGLFDQLDAEMGDGYNNKYQSLRYRTYSLFSGILINHVNTAKIQQKDNIGKACLFIFPSRNPVNELASSMQAKINAAGSKEWIPLIFSPTDKGREGVLTINFSHPEGKIGYDTQVSLEFNTTFQKYVDKDAGFPEEQVKLLGHPIDSFLGWQTGDGKVFNTRLFTEMKQILTVWIKSVAREKEVGSAPATEVPNNNGVDPMLNPEPSKAAPTQSEVSTDDTEVKLPF